MGSSRKSFSSKADRAFNDALKIFRLLNQYPVHSSQYRKALINIMSLSQAAIANNNKHGDSHVLLANTFFLLHIDLFSEKTISFPLKLAASVIQHWNDEPMRQYPWTKNVDNGKKIYDMVSNASVIADPNFKILFNQEMKKLKHEFYDKALNIRTLSELVVEKESNIISLNSKFTEKDLEVIWRKWTSLEVPQSIKDQFAKAAEPLIEYLTKLLNIGIRARTLEISKSDEFEMITGQVITTAIRGSFMVGLECASINFNSDALEFLKIAGAQTIKFFGCLIVPLMKNGTISETQEKEITDEMTRNLFDLMIECYWIGINFYDENIR